MRACISEATTLSSTFAEDVAAYADAGCPALEVWLTKLETHLEKHSPADTRKLIEDRQMTLAAASYQGGLLLSQGEQRKAHFDHFKRRLDLCQTSASRRCWSSPISSRPSTHATWSGPWCRCVRRPSGPRPSTFGWPWSSAAGAPSAPVSTRPCRWSGRASPTSASTSTVFHYYTGPSKFEDLALLTPANLFFVQVCDVAGVPRELATDADRILPGEGDFQLGPIMQQLRAIGYDGWVSLELMNPVLWQMKASQVAELGLGAVQRLLENRWYGCSVARSDTSLMRRVCASCTSPTR